MALTEVELVIVGSGPAGLSAAAHAQANGLDYLLLERTDHLSDTIFCYQKGKHVMAEPGLIPLRSALPFDAGSREEVLDIWERCVREQGLRVELEREVERLEAVDGGFQLHAGGDEYRARKVVLAIGTQGSPRRLGVPGEELPHVSSRLVDPAEVRDQDVVVVGAGDSALEVALALCDHNRVSLIVRRAEIVRAKESLEREVLSRQASGRLTIHFSSTVRSIEEGFLELDGADEVTRIPAQRVFLKIGTNPPRRLLEGFGVQFSGPQAEAKPVLSPVYESSVPGLFLIGAVSGRDLIKLGMNQGYEVVEHLAGRDVLPADEEILRRKLPDWSGTVSERIAQLQDEIPLFAEADELQLREVLLAAELRGFDVTEEILHQHDYTDSFLVLTAGQVVISISPEGGEERDVATLSPGNFFGEMSLLSGRRRNATATASTACRLLEIPRKAMLNLLLNAPAVQRLVDQTFLIRAFQGYLFPDVAERLLWELVAMAEVRRVDRDQVIFEEGQPGDAFYLLRSGMVKISKRSGDREIVLSYLVAGNQFGETALLSAAPRTATVSTIFPSELIVLSKDNFDLFLDRHPELRSGILEKLEERRVATLLAEATPGSGAVLSDLIREEVVMGTDVLIIDDHKCVRCSNCIHACEGVHEDGQSRLSLTGIKLFNLLAPNSCWQCENPLCMLDCPPDAIARDPRGEVYIKSNCIGCGACEENCPYGNIFMVHPKPKLTLWSWVKTIFGGEEPVPTELDKTVAVKCDLCRDIPGGAACVRSCPTGAAVRLGSEEYRQTLEELVIRQGGG